jgi:hypothetical protein
MKYPIFNISLTECDEELFSEMFFYNSIFYDFKNLNTYMRYYQGRHFVDVNGDVYLLIGLKDNSSWLRKRLKLKRKFNMIFKPTNQKLSFLEVKSIYLNNLQGFNSEEAKHKHVVHANNCKTLSELL